MFSIGKQSAADVYRETLEEQVLLLDRQLRQAQDEMAKLRKQFTTRTAIPSTSKISNQERNLLKQQLSSLTIRINQLERMKLDFEDMLQKESIKVQELATKLAEQEQLTLALQEIYIKQLQKAQKQLQQLQ
jgi:hypothetical protein